MELANTIFKRTLGLMFRKDGEMLFYFPFNVRFSIWTPFMRFPLDLFFMDRDFKVVDAKRDMKPWRFYKPMYPYRYFFEAKAGKYKSPPKEVKKVLN